MQRSDQNQLEPRKNHCVEMERFLLRNRHVRDCLLVRTDADGESPDIVAYVVLDDPDSLAAVTQYLSAGDGVPITLVPVAFLPLDEQGDVNVQRLLQCPVHDDFLINHVQEQCDKIAGDGQCVVVRTSDRVPRKKSSERDLTQSDIRDLRGSGAPVTGAAVAARLMRPSVVEGDPLTTVLPESLVSTLQNAAETDSLIHFLNDSGEKSSLTYAELLRQAQRISATLQFRGVTPGDPIVIQIADPRQMLLAFWGIVFAGAVPLPLPQPAILKPTHSGARRLSAASQLLGNPVVVTTRSNSQDVTEFLGPASSARVMSIESLFGSDPAEPPLSQPRQGDVAILLMTSGSSGKPKLVSHTHRSLLSRSASTCQQHAFDQRDVSLNWMPLDHVGGLIMFHLRDVFAACSQVQVPTQYVLSDPLRWIDLLDEYQATATWAPNFAFALVVDRLGNQHHSSWDLHRLRFLLNGGEEISPSTASAFVEALASLASAIDLHDARLGHVRDGVRRRLQ